MIFEKVKTVHDANGRRDLVPTGEPDQHFPCDDVLVAVGQENAFPWIERDCGIAFDKWNMPKVDTTTMASSHPKVFFGGDAAFGPKNIIWAVAHGHDAAISIDRMCRGEDIAVRPAPQVAVLSQKMGIHEWSFRVSLSWASPQRPVGCGRAWSSPYAAALALSKGGLMRCTVLGSTPKRNSRRIGIAGRDR